MRTSLPRLRCSLRSAAPPTPLYRPARERRHAPALISARGSLRHRELHPAAHRLTLRRVRHLAESGAATTTPSVRFTSRRRPGCSYSAPPISSVTRHRTAAAHVTTSAELAADQVGLAAGSIGSDSSKLEFWQVVSVGAGRHVIRLTASAQVDSARSITLGVNNAQLDVISSPRLARNRAPVPSDRRQCSFDRDPTLSFRPMRSSDGTRARAPRVHALSAKAVVSRTGRRREK